MQVQRLSEHGVLEGNWDPRCGGVDTRRIVGRGGCPLVKGCGTYDPSTIVTPDRARAPCQAWPQLHLPKEGGRSRASCPMDGRVTITEIFHSNTGHLLSTRHRALQISSCNPDEPTRQLLWLPTYTRGNRGLERLRNLAQGGLASTAELA